MAKAYRIDVHLIFTEAEDDEDRIRGEALEQEFDQSDRIHSFVSLEFPQLQPDGRHAFQEL